MSRAILPTARLLTLGLAVAWFLSAGLAPAQEKKEDPKKKEEKPLEVKSTDLAKEYRTDSEAADKKYKGKQLLITGKVFLVQEKEGIVELEGYTPKGEAPTLVQCHLAKGKKAVKAKRGDDVKLLGTCDGLPSKFVLVVKDCDYAK